MRIPGFGRKEPDTTVDPATGVVMTTPPRDITAAERMHAEQRQALGAEKVHRDAYEAGRKDALRAAEAKHKKRHGHPVLATMVVLVALVGALAVALAVREGSFSGAGQVVDREIAQVTNPAREAARTAAERSGAAVANAGQTLEQQGEKIRQSVE